MGQDAPAPWKFVLNCVICHAFSDHPTTRSYLVEAQPAVEGCQLPLIEATLAERLDIEI